MGACASVDKHPESDMKLRLSVDSKNEKLVILSPIKQKPETVVLERRKIADVASKSQWSPARTVSTFRHSGSKEETFYDSQPWLESDCEDDFFSVNGDFTPSRGSTPVHHNFSVGTALVNQVEVTPCSATPPSEKRKKLSELFSESFRGNQDTDEQNVADSGNGVAAKEETGATIPVSRPKSVNSTTNAGYGSPRVTNGSLRAHGKSVNSAQCCLPRFLSSCNFTQRK